MRDKKLYQQILGIESPWFVSDVALQLESGKVIISVDMKPDGVLQCPICGQDSAGYDRRKRRWRHLNTCQYQTIIEADVPRIACNEHGVHQISVSWAESGSRFTALFEALVIDWLQEANLSAVSRQLSLSWDEASGILGRAVKRGLSRRDRLSPMRIGVDETAFRKRHEYVTVVSDISSGTVLYVADDRRQKSLDEFYQGLDEEQRESIESVAMDMWQAYQTSTLEYIPDAEHKICFDKFHVAKHLGDAVNKVRRQEHKFLLQQGSEQLKKTRYLWLKNPKNMDRKLWQSIRSLRTSSLKTARAWAIKEMAMSLWNYATRGWARKAWLKCLSWAMRCRLEPVKDVARMLKEHLWGILNAVVLNITNAASEGINAQIQKIKSMACGYRNRERFKNMIYFRLGGLDLYPEGIKHGESS